MAFGRWKSRLEAAPTKRSFVWTQRFKFSSFPFSQTLIGILAATGCVNSDKAAKMIFCGELALVGRVKPVTCRWRFRRGTPAIATSFS